MIQKARKDMLENGNQIKKTIKPGYTMPHATTMAELELNKKEEIHIVAILIAIILWDRVLAT